MPTDTARGTERCETHPGSVAVAHCERCDRRLCLTCAIPVRGEVLGAECLPPDAIDDGPIETPRVRIPAAWRLAGLGSAIAAGSTLFPWTRFGDGSGWFGAWGGLGRWSSLAATAACLALVVWLVRPRASHPWRSVVVAILGAVAVAGAVLAIANPPPFTKASLAPWVSLLGAAAAAVAAAIEARHVRQRGH